MAPLKPSPCRETDMKLSTAWERLPFQKENRAARINGDADRLVGLWGAKAYDIARDLSWREDSGLLRTPHVGYWAAVSREIGNRYGIAEGPAFSLHLRAA
jgi:hypothetical protein